MIAENPSVTSDLMALGLEMTRREIEKIIAKLKEEGIINRSGSRKTGYWEMIEKE